MRFHSRGRNRRAWFFGAAAALGALIAALVIVAQRDPTATQTETIASGPPTQSAVPESTIPIPTPAPARGVDGSTARCTGPLPVTVDTAHGFIAKVISGPSVSKGVTVASWESNEGVRINAVWPGSGTAPATSTTRFAGRLALSPEIDAVGPMYLVYLTDEQLEGPCATVEFTATATDQAVLDKVWPTVLDNLAGTFEVTPSTGVVGTTFTVVGAPSHAFLIDTIRPALQRGQPIDVHWWNDGAFTGAEGDADISAVIGAATLDVRGWLHFTGTVPAQLSRYRSTDGHDRPVDVRAGDYAIGFGHRLDRQSGATFTVTAGALWRPSSAAKAGAIVAVDPAVNDLIVLDNGRSRQLHVLDAVPNRGTARVAGAIAASNGFVYVTVWAGDPAVASIWKVPLDGGPAEKYADGAANPAIAADGQTIAFARGTTLRELVVRDFATGRELTADAPGLLGMRWSPDGRRLAIVVGGEDASFVRIAEVAADQLRVSDMQGDRPLGSPVWLDNSTILATNTNGGGANAPPYMVNVATMHATALEGWPYFTCIDVSRSTGRLLGIVQQGINAGELQVSNADGQVEPLSTMVAYAQWAD